MSKVKVYTSYGGMIGPDGTGPVDPETYYVSRYDYHALAARVRELEAAVRWRVGPPLYPDADGVHRYDLSQIRWMDAHPIVREVIEKGEE